VSAISIAALAIADLHQNGWHGEIQKGKQRGTSNVGVIEGGAATNVVTDLVTLRAEARSHDPIFRKRIVDEIEKSFSRAARKVRNTDGTAGEVDFHSQLDYESFCLPTNSPGVSVAKKAIEAFGLEADLAIANGGVDANWMSARGIPTVSLGCGQKHQHMVTESLDLDAYLTACQIAAYLATAGGV
jgi:tripeptide aminopeptidase